MSHDCKAQLPVPLRRAPLLCHAQHATTAAPTTNTRKAATAGANGVHRGQATQFSCQRFTEHQRTCPAAAWRQVPPPPAHLPRRLPHLPTAPAPARMAAGTATAAAPAYGASRAFHCTAVRGVTRRTSGMMVGGAAAAGVAGMPYTCRSRMHRPLRFGVSGPRLHGRCDPQPCLSSAMQPYWHQKAVLIHWFASSLNRLWSSGL